MLMVPSAWAAGMAGNANGTMSAVAPGDQNLKLNPLTGKVYDLLNSRATREHNELARGQLTDSLQLLDQC
jgi:hypothetical protein